MFKFVSSWQKPTNTDTQLVSAAEFGEILPILLGDKSQNLCIFWILWHGLYILFPVRIVFTFLMVSLKFNTRFLVLKIHSMRSVLSKLTRSSVVKQSPEAFCFLITEILDPCNIILNFYVLSLWQLACTLPHFRGCLRSLMVESYAVWPLWLTLFCIILFSRLVHVESPFLSSKYFIVCLYNTLYFDITLCVCTCVPCSHMEVRDYLQEWLFYYVDSRNGAQVVRLDDWCLYCCPRLRTGPYHTCFLFLSVRFTWLVSTF